MRTPAEEIKLDIASADAAVAFAKDSLKFYSEKAEAWRVELADREAHRASLQGQLEREEAPLVKPQPQGVKAGPFYI